MMKLLARFLPFLRWFPISGDILKADLIAGITVALVLIPQSMAYAQLAGMPPYYGLYAAFLPVAIAAMWGSSRQLGTGPVAVVSLLTASSIAQLATPGTTDFVALAILLALLVGLVQLTLGLLKLGVIVNFLSHPVIVGFTNAAALIIGLSQVSKLFGVPMGRSEHFINDILGVFKQVGDTHLPTLFMGILAIGIIWGVRRYRPKLPGVLIAVVVTTLLSWAVGYEHDLRGHFEDIADAQLNDTIQEVVAANARVEELENRVTELSARVNELIKDGGETTVARVMTEASLTLTRTRLEGAKKSARVAQESLRKVRVVRTLEQDGLKSQLFAEGHAPQGAELESTRYRIRKVTADGFQLVGGGAVVGAIPEGLPTMKVPEFRLDVLGTLLSTALIISLVGFMEAISIAKAMAAKTRQRVDPNQELIGQGLSNIVGSLSQSFPVSGSFSRSAVNLGAGARTGMSSVITASFVLLTLLFLTPLLYHLPQPVLAAVIIMAVIGLINFKSVKHSWKACKDDGVAAVITFVATLGFAPHLDKGIMVGAGLALALYLYRTMSPRVAMLGRYKDGTLRDLKVNPDLPTSRHMIAIRFDGTLYFANVSYFEDTVLEAVANHPEAKYVLIVGDGINGLDASGEEVLHHVVHRLKVVGVTVVFSGLKKQVLDVMRSTHLFEEIAEENIFATSDRAIADIYNRIGEPMGSDDFRPSMAVG